jgi:secreted Zn-dependent insulinase-like peptidase
MGILDYSKSKSDKKEYELLLLPNSNLECVLVSTLAAIDSCNEEVPQAAAALTVSVGSFSDPNEAQGLAHFLEHMVFMGSEKYPKENHYDSFMQEHGGSCNAYTETEHTTYQFDCTSEHFADALDIFACCFHSPKLSRDAVNREIKAIESEFSLAKQSDSNRLQQVPMFLSLSP